MIDRGQFMSCKWGEIFIKYIIPVDNLLHATNNASSLTLKLKHVLLKNNEHISYVLTKGQYSAATGEESLSLSHYWLQLFTCLNTSINKSCQAYLN